MHLKWILVTIEPIKISMIAIDCNRFDSKKNPLFSA